MAFATNIFPLGVPAPAGGPTFGDLAAEYVRTEATRLVRPQDITKHIEHLSPLLNLRAHELRPAVIKSTLYGLLAPAGPMSASTVNKIRGTGLRIIREAMFNQLWLGGPNPFELVRRLPQPKPITRSPSLEELRAALPHLRHDRRREALAMVYLGLRPGELKGMYMDDIDWQTRTLTIRRSNGRTQTKTGRERLVPVPDALWPHLEEARLEVPPECPLLFPGREGRRQREDAKFSRALKTAFARAGLVTGYEYVCRRGGCGYREKRRVKEPAYCAQCRGKMLCYGIPIPVRFYDLRHAAATLHRKAGADPLAVQLALGHAPENLTDGVYTHLTLDDIRAELNKLKI